MTTYRTPQSLVEMIHRTGSARGRRLTGLYSIEGTRLVERALRAGAPLEAVLVAQRFAESADLRNRDLLAALQTAGCPLTIAHNDVLAELTEGRDLGLILGLVQLPSPVALANLLSPSGATSDKRPVMVAKNAAPPLLLAAVDIVDPGNVGALTRTAHAAGARALLVVGASEPFHPRATRISRGSIFKLPVISYETAAALLADLRRHDVALVGTAATGGVSLPQMAWPPRSTVILMGNEAEGLPSKIRSALDYNVTIPMPEGVDSYSVNAAAAIILYTAAQAQNIGD
jgi:TrmH family RNA methyltransferase